METSQFSGSYYIDRFDLFPSEGEYAKVSRKKLEALNEKMYDKDELTRLDTPLMMKHNNITYITKKGENVDRHNRLHIPNIDEVKRGETVLILDPSRFNQFFKLTVNKSPMEIIQEKMR